MKKGTGGTRPEDTEVAYRDFWGMAADKRKLLLSTLPSGSKGTPAPKYEPIKPTAQNRWRLSPHTQEAGYESWPSLEELFPVNYQGVNHNRGLEGSVIDPDRIELKSRISAYLNAKTFDAARAICPDLATERARYEPETVWKELKGGGFQDGKLVRFLVFPFDQRWLYYETKQKWLNEARPEFGANLHANEFLITVPEPRKVSEARPLFSSTLVNLHVHERGSVVIPRDTRGDDLLTDRDANVTEATWRVLREHFSLRGERRDKAARQFMGQLLRVAMAMLHAPAYQNDHKSALAADWAHVPVPKDRKLFDEVASAGDNIAHLLDVNRDANALVVKLLGDERAAALGRASRRDGKQVRGEDLRITIKYWAGGKGRWVPRSPAVEEEFHSAWGERTGDLFISDEVFFANVPEEVWTYQLGGYPLLKKWLSYRQADRQDGKALTNDERRWFRAIVQRIAAILVFSQTLDHLYSEAAANAFTAAGLGVER